MSVATKGLALVFAIVVCPYLCRHAGLHSPQRCAAVIFAVLALNIAEAMPLYCNALFIPVLGTLCAVLGEKRGLVETSNLLVANIFNNVSFTVLGALVINGIFVKCQLERRLMRCLLSSFTVESPMFLLMLMMGTMAVCSVLYSGSIMLLSALKPVVSREGCSPAAAKRLFLAVAFASNAGSTWLPISSPVNLITIALLGEFEIVISTYSWIVVAIPVATAALFGLWLILLCVFSSGR